MPLSEFFHPNNCMPKTDAQSKQNPSKKYGQAEIESSL